MERIKTRREFIKTVGLGTAGLAGTGLPSWLGCRAGGKGPRVPADRPNILFITTDYQAGRDIPSESAFLDMPALGRLCREGVVFDRYYSTAPVCMPARYTLISGRYPHAHGEQDNADRWLPEGMPTLPELLGRAGYHTVGIGKMHFYPWDRSGGFDRRIIADRKGNYEKDAEYRDDYALFLAAHGLSRWDYLKLQKPAEIFGVYDWPFDSALHIDAFVGDQAANFIGTGGLRAPWFLWVSFNGPHNPWDPPAEFSRPYIERDLPKAKYLPGELSTKPKDQTRLRFNYTREVVDLIDRNPGDRERIIHRIRAGHYGGLSLIDRQVERILKALEDGGLVDRTIVVYSSDHGSCLGDHDLIHKGVIYDASARVPFIVRCPERYEPRHVKEFAGHIDFLPTILSLAGTAIPAEAEGMDLTPSLLGKTAAERDHAIIEVRGLTGIVTDGWKMSVHPKDGDGELYDLEADPDEFVNLYGRPQYAEVQSRLLELMKKANPTLDAALKEGSAAR